METDDGTLTEANSSQATEVAPGTSAPNNEHGVEGSPSAPAGQGVKKPTLSEALDKVQLEEPEDAGESGEEPEGEAAAGAPTDEQEAEAGEAGLDGAAGTKDGQPAGDGKAEGSLNQGFGKMPEWQAVMKLTPPEKRGEVIKAMRPVFEKAFLLEGRLAKFAPAAELVREFRGYAGDEQGFNTMRKIIRDYATDPAASVPVLEQMLEDARGRAGLVVTSPDLKARMAKIDEQVEAGTLDGETAATWKADLVEAEKARAGFNIASRDLLRDQRQRQQQTAQAEAQAREAALNEWETKIRGLEPSYGEVTEADDPNHGKSLADEVLDALTLYFTRNKTATPKQLVAEADRVLKLAKSRRGQPMRTQRVITSEGSSINAKRKPQNVMDAMNQVKLT